MIDVAAYIGPYPFRQLPHPDPDVLVRVLEREGLSGAWVGYLPSAWQRDPSPGNASLFAALASYPTLRPAPVIRPDWPNWERDLRDVVDLGAAAVRTYPMHWGMGPHDPSMRALAVACGELGIPMLLTVRFEDLRQRSSLDVAGDLTAAHVRAMARAHASLRIVVVGAGRDLLEETHWGLTPEEQGRVFWDFAWIWGPPEDHLAHLVRTVGAARFVYGTHWPLRLTQNPRANLDLLPPDLQGVGITDASVLALDAVRKTPT
jgi:predicted TIM-barrel fold metal-dependent hydrolase